MSAPNDEYQPTDAGATETGGTGPEATQNDYVSRTGQSEIKVQSDDAAVEGGYEDPATADSDAQLRKYAPNLHIECALTRDRAR